MPLVLSAAKLTPASPIAAGLRERRYALVWQRTAPGCDRAPSRAVPTAHARFWPGQLSEPFESPSSPGAHARTSGLATDEPASLRPHRRGRDGWHARLLPVTSGTPWDLVQGRGAAPGHGSAQRINQKFGLAVGAGLGREIKGVGAVDMPKSLVNDESWLSPQVATFEIHRHAAGVSAGRRGGTWTSTWSLIARSAEGG